MTTMEQELDNSLALVDVATLAMVPTADAKRVCAALATLPPEKAYRICLAAYEQLLPRPKTLSSSGAGARPR